MENETCDGCSFLDSGCDDWEFEGCREIQEKYSVKSEDDCPFESDEEHEKRIRWSEERL